MSYDPFAPGSEPPPPDYGPAGYQPTGPSAVRQRVTAPAIGLIVVGFLNLLWALYLTVNALAITVMTPQQIMAQYEAMGMQAATAGKNPDELKTQGVVLCWPLAVFSFVASLLPVLGGFRLLSLKSYALAMCGAISAAVPCISATACCGLGEAIGIWAIIVLLNDEVKSAFQ
jgi:hypothetical protein